MLKNIKPLGLIIKNGIKYGFYAGFCCGMILPNNICITKYTNGKKKSHLTSQAIFPIFCGLIGISSFICFPLLFTKLNASILQFLSDYNS